MEKITNKCNGMCEVARADNKPGEIAYRYYCPKCGERFNEWKQSNVTPILIIQVKGRLYKDQYFHLQERLKDRLKMAGWEVLIIDNCNIGEVRAFGVPESNQDEWDALKKVLEDQIKKND